MYLFPDAKDFCFPQIPLFLLVYLVAVQVRIWRSECGAPCKIGGHEIDAYRCTSNERNNQLYWLRPVNKEAVKIPVSHQETPTFSPRFWRSCFIVEQTYKPKEILPSIGLPLTVTIPGDRTSIGQREPCKCRKFAFAQLLIMAAAKGHVHIVSHLLDNEVDTAYEMNKYSESELTLTARFGLLDIVKVLLSRADEKIGRKDELNQSYLNALLFSNSEMVHTLLPVDAEVSFPKDAATTGQPQINYAERRNKISQGVIEDFKKSRLGEALKKAN
ncbi:hypothetical protein ACTXT7_003211 [Hymenolepis weldensis]